LVVRGGEVESVEIGGISCLVAGYILQQFIEQGFYKSL
jgi:hypothetical protein